MQPSLQPSLKPSMQPSLQPGTQPPLQPPTQPPKPRFGLLASLILALCLAAPSAALAASSGGTSGDASGSSAPKPPPALGSFGVSAGFPSYQTVAPFLTVQDRFVGFQLKVSDTALGPYVGLELRGYPPVPIPVPVFVGVGGGFYGGDTTYFATLGANVPLGLHVRLDLEGGVANVPLLSQRSWAPYLSLGLSYAFPFEPTYGGQGVDVGMHLSVAPVPSACTQPTKPDPRTLVNAFHNALSEWLRSAEATYGSVYKDLKYHYSVASRRVRGNYATFVIHYSGSVRTVATNKLEKASGKATVTFYWSGCGWGVAGISY